MPSAAPDTAPDQPIVVEETRGHVRHLTLNRPAQFNALSEAMLDALGDSLERAAQAPDVRVVVLGAAGRAFCAGHDLREMRAHHGEDYYNSLFERCTRVMQAIIELPRPVIARVQGIATAAGCQLVATCDLAVSARSARYAVSGVNLGLFCSTPSVALSRNLGTKRAFEMLVTGDFVDADTAQAYGLVNRVVDDPQLDAAVEALCAAIVAKPPVAVETGKRMFYRQLEMSRSEAYRYAGKTMACNMLDADTVEGVDAFLEKRPPSWR